MDEPTLEAREERNASAAIAAIASDATSDAISLIRGSSTGSGGFPSLALPARSTDASEFRASSWNDYAAARRFIKTDEYLSAVAHDAALALKPTMPKAVVLSCCDEEMAVRIALECLDVTTEPCIYDPSLSDAPAQSAFEWLRSLLQRLSPAQPDRPLVVNMGRSGSIPREWIALSRANDLDLSHLRLVIVAEHAGFDASHWAADAEGSDGQSMLPVQVIEIEDHLRVVDYLERRGFPVVWNTETASGKSRVADQVRDGNWTHRNSQGWKAVLSSARGDGKDYQRTLRANAVALDSEIAKRWRDEARAILLDADPKRAILLIVAVYMPQISIGPFIDICDAIQQIWRSEPAGRLIGRLSQPRFIVTDRLLDQCGLRFESDFEEDSARVIFEKGDQQFRVIAEEVERCGTLSRSRLFDAIARLALAGTGDPAVQEGVFNLLEAVCLAERGDAHQLAKRFTGLITAPAAGVLHGAGLRGELGNRSKRLAPAFRAALEQVLNGPKGRRLISANRDDVMQYVIADLWQSRPSDDGLPVQIASGAEDANVEALAELFRSRLSSSLRDFIPPVHAPDVEFRAAHLFYRLFEEPMFDGRPQSVIAADLALNLVIALEVDLFSNDELSRLSGYRHRFAGMLFMRLLIQATLAAAWTLEAADEHKAALAKLWLASPASYAGLPPAARLGAGAALVRGLTHLVTYLRETAEQPIPALPDDPRGDYSPEGRFWLFNLIVEHLTESFRSGEGRWPFLARCVTRSADLGDGYPDDLLLRNVIWNKALAPELRRPGALDPIDRMMDDLLRTTPVIVLLELLPEMDAAGHSTLGLLDEMLDLKIWSTTVADAFRTLDRFLTVAAQEVNGLRVNRDVRQQMLQTIETKQKRFRRLQHELSDLTRSR